MHPPDANQLYNVYLTGELLPGRQTEDVVSAVADLYRADRQQVDRLLAAAPRICKSNVNLRRAQRHVDALRRAGAVAVIEAQVVASGLRDTEESNGAASSGWVSPSASEPEFNFEQKPDVRSAPEYCRDPELEPDIGLDADPKPKSVPDSRTEPDSAVASVGRGGDLAAVDPAAASDQVGATPAPEPIRLELEPNVAADVAAPLRSKGSWQPALLGLAGGLALGILATWGFIAAVGVPDNIRPADARLAAGAGTQPLPQRMDELAAPDPKAERSTSSQPVAIPDAELVTAAAEAVLASPLDAAGPEPTADDGPFGLRQGMALAELDIAAPGSEPGLHLLASVPRPMAGMQHIIATVADDAGLCGITAQSLPIAATAEGVALRGAFGEVEAELDRRYGAQRRVNIRLSRTAPGSASSFMQGLVAGERTFSSVWTGRADAPLDHDLDRITLSASAETEEAGLIRIAYRFRNHDDCAAELAGVGTDVGPASPQSP